jgi:hypothetical protein
MPEASPAGASAEVAMPLGDRRRARDRWAEQPNNCGLRRNGDTARARSLASLVLHLDGGRSATFSLPVT